jgi:hypothetical protein
LLLHTLHSELHGNPSCDERGQQQQQDDKDKFTSRSLLTATTIKMEDVSLCLVHVDAHRWFD